MFNITDKIKGYALKAVGVLLCAGLVWGNLQILNAKNERIESQGKEITTLKKDKELLKEELRKKVKSEGITEDVKVGVKQEEIKLVQAKTKANLYVEKKLADIETKYANKEKTQANETLKRTEISLERAKGLWLTFCLQEPAEPACK